MGTALIYITIMHLCSIAALQVSTTFAQSSELASVNGQELKPSQHVCVCACVEFSQTGVHATHSLVDEFLANERCLYR